MTMLRFDYEEGYVYINLYVNGRLVRVGDYYLPSCATPEGAIRCAKKMYAVGVPFN